MIIVYILSGGGFVAMGVYLYRKWRKIRPASHLTHTFLENKG